MDKLPIQGVVEIPLVTYGLFIRRVGYRSKRVNPSWIAWVNEQNSTGRVT